MNIEYSRKIIVPEIPGYYYSREQLMEKILLYESKRLILITAPAGYGKTSFSIEYFHKLKRKYFKLWISLSTYDNSIENFFLLLALAFENNFPGSSIGAKIKKTISFSQSLPLKEKINHIVSHVSNDLYFFLKDNSRSLSIFLDDFHNIDDSIEICEALNYMIEFLPSNLKFIFISRRDPKSINFPKFAAKGWLGRISRDDLKFSGSDIRNFTKKYSKRTAGLRKSLLEEYLKTTEGWVTAIQLLLMTRDINSLKNEDLLRSRNEIFEYFTKEIYENCSDEEKELLLTLSFLEYFSKDIIERGLGMTNAYHTLIDLYEANVFINRENEIFRFHELLRSFLNKIAVTTFSQEKTKKIYRSLGKYYLQDKEWREDYIALNYMILGEDYESLKSWIRMNASDKLLLIHSSGLFKKIEMIENADFRSSLEYILLRVNTFVYKDKEVDKAIDFLEVLLRGKFEIPVEKGLLIPVSKISKINLNYYIEILMLISNCNFLKEGISRDNIKIAEHILKFKLRKDQEIQFIVALVKSYIATGENSKSKKHVMRLKEILNEISSKKFENQTDENILVENIFSMLIFFDYGDYKTGNQVIKFIINNLNFKNFDLSNYSQVCFAMFTSYDRRMFDFFFNFLREKNNAKEQTVFSAYKNQFEFQSILWKFLNHDFKTVIKELELIKKNIHLRNYIFFIDSLLIYCHNLLNQPLMAMSMIRNDEYKISKTRSLMLQLEAGLLSGETDAYLKAMCEIEKLGKENFTLFNQALILFCECYYHAVGNNVKLFREKFRALMNMCIEFDYGNYLMFRAKSNRLNFVFEFALRNKVESVYLKDLFEKAGLKYSVVTAPEVIIDVRYLENSRILINGKELPNELWQRSKSKSIFLYLAYKEFKNQPVTKETLIDDILYTSKSVNYDAIADVEINKVRKTLHSFLSEILGEKLEKDVLILRDRKYLLTSKRLKVTINIDAEEFRKLAHSSLIEDNIKAIEMYKTDFANSCYNNWAEDNRENLKYIFSKAIQNVVPHFEKEGDSDTAVRLLERMLDIDYGDEGTVTKLLSIYSKKRDYGKLKFAYRSYEKRLKKEFNSQPSAELKKLFGEANTHA